MNTNNYLKVRQGNKSVEFFFDRYNDLSKASARQAAHTLARALRAADPETSVEITIYRHCKDGFAFLQCVGAAFSQCPTCSGERHLRLVASTHRAP